MTMQTEAPIRFAIVGCGTIASTHAEAIRQIEKLSDGVDATLVAVYDPVAERAKNFAETFRVPQIHVSEEELLADPQIDALCLCTPSGLHMTTAVEAMQAGKHVVSEKPMDVTVEACDRAIAAEAATGKVLTIISQHRFDPATVAVKAAIDSGALGKIVLANAAVPCIERKNITILAIGAGRGRWMAVARR